MTKIQVGVVSTGKIAEVHTQNLRKIGGVELGPVFSRNLERAAAFMKQYKFLAAHSLENRTSLQYMNPDALIICSPAETHCDLIEWAATSGVEYIFCEKPVGRDIPTIEKMLKVVDKHNAQLQIGFNRRFDPAFMALREQMLKEVYGEVFHLEITSLDPASPSSENLTEPLALITETMVHDLDTVRWFLGDNADCISVFGETSDPELEQLGQIDTAIAQLQFPSGAMCRIRNHWGARHGYVQRVEVHGTKDWAKVDNTHGLVGPDEFGIYHETPAVHPSFADRYDRSYRAEMKAFIKSVKEGSPVLVSGEEALATARLVGMALESCRRSGQALTL